MLENSAPLLIEATRSALVEKEYLVDVFACDSRGNTLISLGDIERMIYPRSAIKLIQALETVESGAADHFGFGGGELAVACSSHFGEVTHIAAAQSMLAKAGLKSTLLMCGSKWPRHEASKRSMIKAQRTPGPLHHPCSGKHSCGLCLLAYLGEDLQDYTDPGHPLQRRILRNIERFTGEDMRQVIPGLDGCSYPTYPLPLNRWAVAMARIADPSGFPSSTQKAVRTLRQAVEKNPFMTAGEDAFISLFMREFGHRLYIKDGADGVMMVAINGSDSRDGMGLVLKVRSGQRRIALIATVSLLGELGILTPDQVSGWAMQKRHNANGLLVGEIRVILP